MVVMLIMWAAFQTVGAQTFTLTGKVVDEENNAIELASVSCAQQGKMVMTDLKGEFTITLKSQDSVVVKFSMVGYNSRKRVFRNPRGKQNVSITLPSMAACCGFLYTLDVAASMIQSGRYKKIIVIGADKMSSLVDYTDRATCVLFGDGAGAVLVEATEEENVGVQNSYLRTDGQGLPFLHMKAGGSVCPPSHFTVDHRLHYLYQEGRTVFRYAVTDMSNDVMKIMEMNNLKAEDVNWVIPHEANLRIIEAVTKRAGIPLDKVVVNIDHYGNTSAATIPLALWDAESQLKKGDNVIFTAFGAGFVHGASFYKWAYDGAAFGK